MANDYRIIFPRGNPGKQPPAVGPGEVFLRGRQNTGSRIELHVIRRPLSDKVIRDNNHGFPRQAHADTLLNAGYDCIGFASADTVIKQNSF